jgi:hypothetical protein
MTGMKHLLNGVAIAAALAIAAPVWAQTSPTAPAPAPSGGTDMSSGTTSGTTMKKHRKARAHHTASAMHHTGKKGKAMSSGEMTTEQLNRQELARVTGGAPAPMPDAAPAADTAPAPRHKSGNPKYPPRQKSGNPAY